MSDVDILFMYRKGLQRVSKVVDANPGYDDLLEYRLSNAQKDRFSPRKTIEEKRRAAVDEFERALRSGKHKVISTHFSGFVCHGRTKNNLKEFDFFERLLSVSNIRIHEKNYANVEEISRKRIGSSEISFLEHMIEDVTHYFDQRHDITAGLVRQLALYGQYFFGFHLSFSHPHATLPKALVLANDHSPVPVALSMVMGAFAVPRIYLQHAEVTPNFPELDFEFSVLRNLRSLKTYESIGTVTGDVFVIPRDEQPFAREKLVAERPAPTTVTIYPTSRVIIDDLRETVDALESNDQVGKVVIKQHPAAQRTLDHLEFGPKTSVSNTISGDHIAIVGNSSVATELLHQGIPVYQKFGLDPVARDYYKLVEQGITKEVFGDDLKHRFWRPYVADEMWLDAYSQIDPTANSTYLEDKDRFIARMNELAASHAHESHVPRRPARVRLTSRLKAGVKRAVVDTVRSYPGASEWLANTVLVTAHRTASFLAVNTHRAAHLLRTRADLTINVPVWSEGRRGPATTSAEGKTNSPQVVTFLEETLCLLPNPADWLIRNENLQVFESSTVLAALEAMFQHRRPQLRLVLEGFASWTKKSPVSAWGYLKRTEWGNFAIGQDDLSSIVDYVLTYSGNSLTRAALERLLLDTLLRHGTSQQLDRFWAETSTTKVERLGINQRFALAKKLRSTGKGVEADRLLANIAQDVSPLEALKFDNMEFLAGNSVDGWSHEKAEALFAKLAPRTVAAEFLQYAEPSYDVLRSRMRFMEIRDGGAQTEELIGRIGLSIEQKRPFSLVRLSDGEGYFFPDQDLFSEADVANRERHWWGTELNRELRGQIVTAGREALKRADVLGIPAVYRLIRDTNDTTHALTQTVQGRGLLQVLRSLPDVAGNGTMFTEDKVNVSLFGNVEAIVRLARRAKRVVLVCSVVPEHLPVRLSEVAGFEVILLPTHAKTSLNASYHEGDVSLPFCYRALLNRLEAIAEPGALVLVAGGIIGKLFLEEARLRGAVALDIGSVVDDWIGTGMATIR